MNTKNIPIILVKALCVLQFQLEFSFICKIQVKAVIPSAEKYKSSGKGKQYFLHFCYFLYHRCRRLQKEEAELKLSLYGFQLSGMCIILYFSGRSVPITIFVIVSSTLVSCYLLECLLHSFLKDFPCKSVRKWHQNYARKALM